MPPSRSSQHSRLSTQSFTLPSLLSPSLSSSFSPPRPPSSSLSARSEDSSGSEPGFDVQPYLDCLLPSVSALLSHIDHANQITEDVHNLEIKLEEALVRRRKRRIANMDKGTGRFGESAKPKELGGKETLGDVGCRKTGFLYPKPRASLSSSFSFTPSTLHCSLTSMYIIPRTRRTCSESESLPLHPQASSNGHSSEAVKPNSPGSPELDRFPRRRAWHSGSSHSADAAQRIFLAQGGFAACGNGEECLALSNTRPRSEECTRRPICDRVPVKRKAWISEGD